MKPFAILGFGALLMAAPAQAGFTVPPNRPGAYAPREECQTAPGARAFAASLRGAVQRRDANALLELSANDIKLDFGGGEGKALFREGLSGRGGPELWRELSLAVNSGCAVSDGDLVFPWMFAQNLGDVDTYDAMLAVGPAVPLYRRANARGGPIARLNWQIVIAQGDNSNPDETRRPFTRVLVINSPLKGYVATSQLRSVIAYRLIASRLGSGWKITAFVAGD